MSERPVLGIDLGTTYSCVARLDENERVSVLLNSEGDPTTPSVVFYENDGNVLVGKMAKKEVELNEDRVVQLVKRHMGEPGYTVPMGDKELHPQQVSAIILRYIVEDALTELGLSKPDDGILADVVITVPAYFGAGERQATMDAGRIAGLNVVNIINEPTAAAIAYGLTSGGGQQTVLVYDLGGGTFDVTVIEVSPDTIRVIATGGDHALGGADWDERIQDLLAEEFEGQFPDAGDPREDRETGTPLGLVAEDLKKSLSRRDSDTVTVMAHGERAKIELSRAAVVERTEDLVTRTLDFTRDVLAAAERKNVRKIDQLVLVGGMSRSPIIAQRLAATFPDLPEPRLMDPDQIVAKGAALFAARQVAEIAGEDPSGRQLPGSLHKTAGTPGTPEIINVTSKGYGIRTFNDQADEIGHVEFLISPNDEIPSAPQDTFRTLFDNQREVNIEVFESLTAEKHPAVENNKLLVEGRITGLPPGLPAGQPIEVIFDLGDDAILRIRATSHSQVLTLEAKISGSMSEEELRIPLPNIQR